MRIAWRLKCGIIVTKLHEYMNYYLEGQLSKAELYEYAVSIGQDKELRCPATWLPSEAWTRFGVWVKQELHDLSITSPERRRRLLALQAGLSGATVEE